MAESTAEGAEPTLLGWLLRDVVLAAVIGLALVALQLWYQSSGAMLVAALAALVGFVGAYVLCYAVHEWGHLLGARAAGGHMPLRPYKGALIGSFDIAAHSTRQFLWLSWGGVLGYLVTAAVALAVHFGGAAGPAGAGLAVGGLAFVAQSLAVDLPQIVRVQRGADPAATQARGAAKPVILRRTWQAWSVLALALILWNVL